VVKKVGKLVRDKIPMLVDNAKFRRLKSKEYRIELARKLVEEATEFEKDQSLAELADVMEVIRAILAAKKWSLSRLESTRKRKAKERGEFKQKIFLMETPGIK
jgi:predicted house-cleaning noncanonical NTP pyrophosphatase (MazG superfamily)